MTEQLVIILIVIVVLVILDGLRRKWMVRRDRVVLKVDRKRGPPVDVDEDELFKSELPNGGARTLPRKGDPVRPPRPAPKLKSLKNQREPVKTEHVPVLLEAVELEEEQIEHTNVFADTSSIAPGEEAESGREKPIDQVVDSLTSADEEATMGMYEGSIENYLEALDDELKDRSSADRHPPGQGGVGDEWDEDLEGDWEEGDEEDGDEFDEDDVEADGDDDEEDEEGDIGWEEDEDEDWDDDDQDDDLDDEDYDEFGDEEDFANPFDDDEVDALSRQEQRVGDSQQQVDASGRIEPTFGFHMLGKKNQGELFRDGVAAATTPQSRDALIDDNAAAPAQEAAPQFQEVIIINVMSRSGSFFAGEDLLAVLQAQRLRLGDMSIFHRFGDGNANGPVVFSMANMVKPGTFDLAGLAEFNTPGVSFFMQMPNKAGNMQAFDQMLAAATALQRQLDGELKDENRSVFTRQTIEHCRQRVRDFELKLLAHR